MSLYRINHSHLFDIRRNQISSAEKLHGFGIGGGVSSNRRLPGFSSHSFGDPFSLATQDFNSFRGIGLNNGMFTEVKGLIFESFS